MSNKRFHFEIPGDNIRNEKYDKSGFSPSVKRLDHVEHGQKLQIQAQKFIEVEFKKKDIRYTDDLFLQIETPKDITLKSQKLKIEDLGFEILSYSKNNSSLATAAIRKEIFQKFENRLDEYIHTNEHKGKSYFSPIESLSSIPPEDKIKDNLDYESDEEVEILINLFNIIKPKEILAVSNSISEELRTFSELVEQRTFSNGVTTIYCKLQAKNIANIASEFSTIKEIKPSQTFYAPQSLKTESLPNPLKINNPQSDSMVCIIDSGIRPTNKLINPFVKDRIIKLPVGSIDCAYDHGTFVASRCIFGDSIDSCLGSHELNPYCYILDVTVFGKDASDNVLGPSEYHLKCVLEDTLNQYSGTVKVYNLSLGSGVAIIDNQYSDLVKLIDALAKKHKVLFIIAAGNINAPLGNFPADHFGSPLARINTPAESLLGLTVGSIAKHINKDSLSGIDFTSPFSRIGPGADTGIKPEVVAHGGNYIKPYTPSPRIATYGISNDGNNLAVDNGTSYSAPLVSMYAQKLFDAYPQSDPNLVKGLLCHFTDIRNKHLELMDSERTYTGFGEPNIETAIEAGKHNAAYIYEGKLDQQRYQYIKFHVPSSLRAGEENSKLKVKITITYDPPVNPDNEMEYSETRISAALFKKTMAGMKKITISGEDNYNIPWNPLIRFEKSFARAYLNGDWELRLRLFTRGKVEDGYLQDYSVVIELIDEDGGTDVYTDISKEFGTIYETIKIELAA
tara:strand:- start:10468 stop:12672 length:2205 start_codon:yes stop_codon:yes gene_type:complete